MEALSLAVDDATRIAIHLGMDTSVVRIFLDNAQEFAKNNLIELSDVPYALVLNTKSNSGGSPLTFNDVLSHNNKAGNAVFLVDENLHLCQKKNEVADLVNCANLSVKWRKPMVFVQENVFATFVNGSFAGTDVNKARVPVTVAKFERRFVHFDDLIVDHYKNWLHNEKNLKYWHDKSKRLLLGGKTEDLFHGSLFVWLDENITDKVTIFSNPTGVGQEKTDIHVTTVDHSQHVIEVKWLGKNKSNTEYKEDSIGAGLEQVKIYLNTGDYTDGRIVFYDGRQKDISDRERNYPPECRHPECLEPYFIFLESESPSKKAKRVAKIAAAK